MLCKLSNLILISFKFFIHGNIAKFLVHNGAVKFSFETPVALIA